MANDGSSPKAPNAGDTTLDSDATTAASSTLPITLNPQHASPSMEIIIGNEDLTTQILLRLPAKSILGLKTVSKQWRSIITSRRFRQMHASASGAATATGVFVNINTTKLGFISLDNHTSPMPNVGQHIEILSSSGGLLLLLLQFRDFCICNPTTNTILFLNVPEVIRDMQDDFNDLEISVYATLAFDPSKSVHYKVLFVLTDLDSMIYSSETRTFKLLEISNGLAFYNGVYWNDAIHWISRSGKDICYFDLSKECMNHSSFPEIGIVDHYNESQGKLLAVTLVNTETKFEFEVYELKRDYSAWCLKGKVDIDSILPKKPKISKVFATSILEDEKEGLTIVFHVSGGLHTFVVYDVKKQKIIKLLRHKGDLSCAGHHYKPTLACLGT